MLKRILLVMLLSLSAMPAWALDPIDTSQIGKSVSENVARNMEADRLAQEDTNTGKKFMRIGVKAGVLVVLIGVAAIVQKRQKKKPLP